MRIGLALALALSATGCAAEARLSAVVPVLPAPAVTEALDPLPVLRCVNEDRTCWTLARPCTCPVFTPAPAAVAYLELGPGPVIDYLDLEPKRPVEYIELEATP